MASIAGRPLHAIAEDSLGSEEGLAARAAGVTASEIHAIAAGGRGTHRRILADKLNGSTFRGNAHTRRGHEREPFLLAWVAENVADCVENRALYAHPENPLILATPDGLGADGGEPFGVEAKSHDHSWGHRDDIPADHYDQMQFGMYVLGFDRWLYVWEVMGDDGTPTLDAPRYRWVARDEKRIAKLVAEAEAFLAWRAAGAPDADADLPDEIDDALATIIEARAAMAEHKKAEADALAVVRRHAERTAGEHGVKGAGHRASFTYTRSTTTLLDEDAWVAAEPATYGEWVEARERLAATEEAAVELYHREKPSTRLLVTETKDPA